MAYTYPIQSPFQVDKKKTQTIEEDLIFAQKNNLSIVFYRLPESKGIHFIVGENPIEHTFDQLKDKTGFLIQPFIGKKSAYFINPKKQLLLTTEVLVSVQSDENSFYSLQSSVQSTSKQDFEKYVSNAVNEIKSDKYRKLVCAKAVVYNEKLNPLVSFLKLCETYPKAYVSLVSTSVFGTWVGATPEILVEENGNTVHTVALAGTQLYSETNTEKTAAWTTKEIEEQALVSRFIINQFKTIRLREFEDVGPRTIVAGNLLHLKTDFYIDKTEVEFDNLALQIAELIHPTSAVCGMPQSEAQKYILNNENLNRQLYSGFLGYISPLEKQLFVNLRCMQLQIQNTVFYAGAGITKDSIPEKEWQETENKADTLRKVVLG